MAATLTEHSRTQLPGGHYIVTGTAAFSTADSSGSEAISLTGIEKFRTFFVQATGYNTVFDRANQKVKFEVPNGATTGNVVQVAVASGTSLSGVTTAPFFGIGK